MPDTQDGYGSILPGFSLPQSGLAAVQLAAAQVTTRGATLATTTLTGAALTPDRAFQEAEAFARLLRADRAGRRRIGATRIGPVRRVCDQSR